MKLAYQTGDKSGFVYGFEMTVMTNINPFFRVGTVLDYDLCKGNTSIHPGIQFSSNYGGIEIGPTFTSVDRLKFIRGWTANIYTGAIIYPFYGITYYPSLDLTTQQFGAYIKPIVSGSGETHLWGE